MQCIIPLCQIKIVVTTILHINCESLFLKLWFYNVSNIGIIVNNEKLPLRLVNSRLLMITMSRGNFENHTKNEAKSGKNASEAFLALTLWKICFESFLDIEA